ncbi:D-glycero-beta-D-manno-heptose 1-phosphate adenylyltransferase [Henriciella aquimarina]|uniref:D-glycero-beta-D-manno-heptose 1-phosphate adenylyltransferase n=1 Tax=Henriciella aquimarina TaxID=545261 RepID=UPI000A0134F5|nr:D-glycero-beta-D-manno-heptose 1-phosphate adenylyltransferase [Henriciella aquimarina]
MKQQLAALIDQAQGAQVLCVGDVMLDRFVYGMVDRVSPESPVPVLRKSATVEMPGGAGNVARNMAAMGLNVVLVGCIGEDDAGHRLEALLAAEPGIDARLARSSSYTSVVKSRFVASNQQLLRVDTETSSPTLGVAEAVLTSAISKAAANCKAIIVSDYAKGSITTGTYAACLNAAEANGIPLLVDPKSLDFSIYEGASLIKPNAAELSGATGLPTGTDEEVGKALAAAAKKLPASRIVVTRAGRGMSWLEGDTVSHRHGEAKQVFDVSGAGDTSMAAITLGMVGGGSLADAVALGLAASGLAVAKTGTATVSADEIRNSLNSLHHHLRAPVLVREEAQGLVRRWKAEGLKVGFTNGCFDILHPGHLALLEEARARCDRLIVAINSDASVKRLKGETRPVNTESDRARLLTGISAVDAVTVFEEDTPSELIELLLPDLLVKGGDYTEEIIVGAETVKANGGEVHIVELVEGQSTSAILARNARP